jgi:hypothetical protein
MELTAWVTCHWDILLWQSPDSKILPMEEAVKNCHLCTNWNSDARLGLLHWKLVTFFKIIFPSCSGNHWLAKQFSSIYVSPVYCEHAMNFASSVTLISCWISACHSIRSHIKICVCSRKFQLINEDYGNPIPVLYCSIFGSQPIS